MSRSETMPPPKGRLIQRRSPVTGQLNTMFLGVTTEQLHAWRMDGQLIQDAMPNLSPDQREFLISGCTPDDLDSLCGTDDV